MIIRLKDPKHLILGMGEIGKAIFALFNPLNNTNIQGIDEGESFPGQLFHVLHVCFPYGPTFKLECQKYAKEYLAPGGIVIIHSTIPVGTTRNLGPNYVHSPCRGVHPHLLEGIKTFMKFFGGPRAREAAKFFDRLDVPTYTTAIPENTELMKLWETEQYRRFIETMREIKEMCDKHHADFDVVYTKSNESYNAGYAKLGITSVTRPTLYFVPGPTGGHCVEPNHKLLFP